MTDRASLLRSRDFGEFNEGWRLVNINYWNVFSGNKNPAFSLLYCSMKMTSFFIAQAHYGGHWVILVWPSRSFSFSFL